MLYAILWIVEAIILGSSFALQSSIVENVWLASTFFTPYLINVYEVVFLAFAFAFVIAGSIFVRRREFLGAIECVIGVIAAGLGIWFAFYPPALAVVTGAYLPILALLIVVLIQFVTTLVLAKKSSAPRPSAS